MTAMQETDSDKAAAVAAGASSSAAAPFVPEVPSDMGAEADLLETFASAPVISRVIARTTGPSNDVVLQVQCSQRNLPGNSQRRFALHGVLPGNSSEAVMSTPLELPDVVLVAPSPSGQKQLIVKAGGDQAGLILQVWSSTSLVTELLVPKTLHGALVNDGYFAQGVSWSPDESCVAYTAEVPPAEKTPAWGGPESLKDSAGTKSWRGQGSANEDWGELNTGKRAPAVYVVDLRAKAVTKASAQIPDGVSVGQPRWARDGSGLVVVGWTHSFPSYGKKLGVVYCYNRPCRLYFIPYAPAPQTEATAGKWGAPVAITKEAGSALSPAFTPSGRRLVYLSLDTAVATGTHGATAQLYSLPWPEAKSGAAEPEVVVGVVDRPAQDTPASFPGLYAANLLDEPFIDESTLLLTTQWRSQSTVVSVDLTSGQVTPLTPLVGPTPSGPVVGADQLASYSLAAVAGKRLLVTRVGPTCPAQLLVADYKQGASPLNWQVVGGIAAPQPSQELSQLLGNVECMVQSVTPTNGDTSLEFESVVFLPKNRSGPVPAVIAPHGGPHTAVTVGWYMPYAFLASLGYAVICPNYRGSTGYGQAALQSLPGHIGKHDVEDCMAALHAAVDAGIADLSRAYVVGGSHGGFLTGHLIGQYPDTFLGAVLRNPVCNIALMSGLSDIADWCYVEVLGCEEGKRRQGAVASPEVMQRMFEVSPVALASQVKARVILMLGAKDRRVPPPDGQQYAAALRAAGVDVRVLVFPEDTHALDKPQTEYEQWINVAWLLKQTMEKKK